MWRTRYGYRVASVFLVLFYCYMVWLIFSPSPSQNYRLYYLEHKLKYWPQRDGLNYTFGEIIDFRAIVDYMSANGWGDPGRWGTWTDARKATLYLRTQPFSDGRLELCALVRAGVSPKHRLRAVQIRINEKLVDTWFFESAPHRQPAWVVKRSIIPIAMMDRGGLQRLSFMIEGDGNRTARLDVRALQLQHGPADSHDAGRCYIRTRSRALSTGASRTHS